MPESTASVDIFISRWAASSAAERANYQLFLSELCEVIGTEKPQPQGADPQRDSYVFEKPVPQPQGGQGRIDLYKRGVFVLEAKQGSDKPGARRGTAVRGTKGWDVAMEQAYQQAQRYVRNLPVSEIEGGRPPFILVVDVGSTIALYSEWSRTGGNYIPFPDPAAYRLSLEDLRQEDKRLFLRQVWEDPLSLDPARRSARVTQEIATKLAQLARSLEGTYPPEEVASFLMRCLFTMFAEDVGLLPGDFAAFLDSFRQDSAPFQPMLEELWKTMNTGGFSVILRQQLPRFNGGLFANPFALPLTSSQIALLVEAARADWRDVEPAIFGTLLERALDPHERHKLGAHYTPRAYVERLVLPTVIEPLRSEWESVQATALAHLGRNEEGAAIAAVEGFQHRLATLRVLDPACGSGNFLYVTLEQLKRLEGEVLNTLRELGQAQQAMEMEEVMVTPANLLGIEVNPRAAAIADLVLWIGFLQWHHRTHGNVRPPEPIIRDAHNILCQDAVLTWSSTQPLADAQGHPITRWDGRTTIPHPVTGAPVPDPAARIPALRYNEPRPAEWPAADYIVGNPPFIGTSRMREVLGDGYTEALRRAYPLVPESADYVMFWWHRAAAQVRAGAVKRFGFITTNSIRQPFNRRLLQTHMAGEPPLSLAFAIPDHPWVDSSDGAAVRISMTVGASGEQPGVLAVVTQENAGEHDEIDVTLVRREGQILSDLTIGANVAGTVPLRANEDVSNPGVKLHGAGFIVTPEEATHLGLGRIAGLEQHIRLYLNGRDLAQKSRNVMVIDLFGLTETEVRSRFPEVYQWVYERVKPERDANRRKGRRENWWLFGETNPKLRAQLADLPRYITTPETAKHRFFVFLDHSILPDNKLVNIALADAYYLGVLSSRVHVLWALAAGGRLGVGNDPVYVKTRCFETFPFPDAMPDQQARIRDLGEQLDHHRKQRLALHPALTLTDLHNVLEKEQGGEPLNEKERRIHEQGLVGILRQIHDELDAAVADAYGWPADLPDNAILERLVALNTTRAAEEHEGTVRWLRPEYQAPDEVQATQTTLLGQDEALSPTPAVGPRTWPNTLPQQVAALREVLAGQPDPLTAPQVAGLFQGRRTPQRIARIQELLATLAALGHIQATDDERYMAG